MLGQEGRNRPVSKQILTVLAVASLVGACSTPLTTREKGALAGGAIGAGTGAAIGSATGHAGTGALIGAGVGVVSGAVIGDAIQANEQRQASPPPQPPPAMPPTALPPPPPPPPTPVYVAPPPASSVNLDIVIGNRPALVAVPESPVRYAPSMSYNYFAYGGRYYVFHNEVWLSAKSYNGPWAATPLKQVPQPILAVPVKYYKAPPGHWKKQGPPPWAQAKGHEKHEKKEHAKKGREDD